MEPLAVVSVVSAWACQSSKGRLAEAFRGMALTSVLAHWPRHKQVLIRATPWRAYCRGCHSAASPAGVVLLCTG